MTNGKGPGAGDTEALEFSAVETEAGFSTHIANGSKLSKRAHSQTVETVIALLAERWPATFSIHEKKRRPLKVGIFSEILAALDGAVTQAELSKALACYVGNSVYLSRLREGAKRVGLDGAAAGEVTKAEEDRSKMQRWIAEVERQRRER